MPLYNPILSVETKKGGLPSCAVLCVYQASEEDHYLKEWLNEGPDRYLLLLNEDSDTHFYPDEDARIRHYLLSEHTEEETFKQIAWEFVFLEMGFQATQYTERAKEIFSKISFFHMGVHLLASDYRDFGAKVLKNIFANVPHLPQAKEGHKLFNRFKNIPAIICGAGPSLEKNIDQLSSLSDRALIFAGGSSLNVLSRHAIVPHFSASLDPDPPYERFYGQTAFETPFFYQNRVSQDLLRMTHGPMIRCTDSAGYPIDGYLSAYLGLSSHPFDAGWNVATFLCAIARHAGCNPIIFVGMDLAFTNNLEYAGGVGQTQVEKERVELIGERGDPLFSKKDWIIAAEWIESFARDHSETAFVNASEGGLGFEGIEGLSLSAAAQKYLKKTSDLKGYVHSQLMQVGGGTVTKEQVQESLKIIKDSLQCCWNYVSDFLAAIEASYPHLEGIEGKKALFEVELESAIAYEKILAPLWEVWKYVFERQLDRNVLGQILNKLLFFKKVIGETIYG
jgi:hypothetical protein